MGSGVYVLALIINDFGSDATLDSSYGQNDKEVVWKYRNIGYSPRGERQDDGFVMFQLLTLGFTINAINFIPVFNHIDLDE